MTKPLGTREKAWELYLVYRSVERVHKRLTKTEGYVVSLATLQKWCKDDRWVERWNEINKLNREAEKLALDDENRKIIINLKAREPYEKKLDAGDILNPQEVHALLKINDQLIAIEKRIWERKMAEEKLKREITPEQAKEVVDKVFEALEEHPQVGAIINKHREELAKLFEKKMGPE